MENCSSPFPILHKSVKLKTWLSHTSQWQKCSIFISNWLVFFFFFFGGWGGGKAELTNPRLASIKKIIKKKTKSKMLKTSNILIFPSPLIKNSTLSQIGQEHKINWSGSLENIWKINWMCAAISQPKSLQAFVSCILPRLGEISIKSKIYSTFIQNKVLVQVLLFSSWPKTALQQPSDSAFPCYLVSCYSCDTSSWSTDLTQQKTSGTATSV